MLYSGTGNSSMKIAVTVLFEPTSAVFGLVSVLRSSVHSVNV
jgi:hypothetical protein